MVEGEGDLSSPVARTVVCDEQLEWESRLLPYDSLNGLPQVPLVIVCRHQNADQRGRRQAAPIRFFDVGSNHKQRALMVRMLCGALRGHLGRDREVMLRIHNVPHGKRDEAAGPARLFHMGIACGLLD